MIYTETKKLTTNEMNKSAAANDNRDILCFEPSVVTEKCYGMQKLNIPIRVFSQGEADMDYLYVIQGSRFSLSREKKENGEDILILSFDGKGLEAPVEIRDQINIITLQKEYSIPVRIKMVSCLEDEKLGVIKNLFHFANLAQTDFDKAVSLFYSEEFLTLIKGHDKKYLGIYKLLSEDKNNEANVEEFLCAIHKKQKNTYSVEDEALIYVIDDADKTQTLQITRSGWGYDFVRVKTQGLFIHTNKDEITRKDFINNICKLEFSIDSQILHEGINQGRIILESENSVISCSIVVTVPVSSQSMVQSQKIQMQNDTMITRLFLKYCMAGSYEEAKVILEDMMHVANRMNEGTGFHAMARLYQCHIHVLLGQEKNAKWLLEHVEKMLESTNVETDIYAYYLYLKARLTDERAIFEKAVIEMENMLFDNPKSYIPVCLYVDLCNDKLSAMRKLVLFERLFANGINSPVVYMLAFKIIENNLLVVTKLGRFETQVFRFAYKYGLLTPRHIHFISEMTSKKRELTQGLFPFLERLYKTNPGDELLSAICSILIRNEKFGKPYFLYYSEAVQKEMHITGICEAYIMSQSREEYTLPPRNILIHLADTMTLQDKYKAYVYASVIKHQRQTGDLFDVYRMQILEFGKEMLSKQRISRDLGVIYNFMIEEGTKIENITEVFPDLLFAHIIKLSKNDAEKITLWQDGFAKPQTALVKDGEAVVYVYGPEYSFTWQGEDDHRELPGNEDIDIEVFHKQLEKMNKDTFSELSEQAAYYLYESGKEKENIEIMSILALSEQMDASYRISLITQLLSRADSLSFDLVEKIKEYLKDFKFERIKRIEKISLLEALVEGGLYQSAIQILFEYGLEKVEPYLLIRLCEYILKRESEYRTDLLKLCCYVFNQGKYTERILNYLMLYQDGNLQELLSLWEKGKSFELEQYELEKRILKQAIYNTESYNKTGKVFNSYCQKAGDEALARAYIAVRLKAGFMQKAQIEEEAYEQFAKLSKRGDEFDINSKMAYLYHYSEIIRQKERELTENEKTFIHDLAIYVTADYGYAPFFTYFSTFIPELYLFEKMAYISYQSMPGKCVRIYYLTDEDAHRKLPYRCENMNEISDGYYVKSIPMLFGDRVSYYCVEEEEGNEKLTLRGQIEREDIMTDDASRFGMMDDIQMCRLITENESEEELIEKYRQSSILIDKLFKD